MEEFSTNRVEPPWDEKNPLVKHMVNHHRGEEPDFSYKVDQQWKTSLSRQIGEALAINRASPTTLMNSKSE